MKTCTKCGETKPRDDYYVIRKDTGARYTFCKACKSGAVQARRQTPEGRAVSRAWRERPENRAKNSEYLAQWRAENADLKREIDRAWKRKNVVRNEGRVPRADAYKWCGSCETTRTETEFYRNRTTKDGLTLYCKMCHEFGLRKICRRTHGEAPGQTCHLCGEGIRFLKEADVDHLTPRSKGGTDAPANLRWAHYWCNRSRSNKPLTSEQMARAYGARSSR